MIYVLQPSQPLFAYETDVHLGFTQWLAKQAGFSDDEAKDIASGDQGVDDEWSTAPIWLGTQVIFADSERSSVTLSENHFPIDVKRIPGPPNSRAVVAATGDRVDREMQIPYRSKPRTALRDLGAALHAFQDSWSHAGIPDVPTRPVEFYPEYAWSHPVEKGGWTSHDADITPLDDKSKDAARTMACETYRLLQEYYKTNFDGKKKVQDCSSIVADILTFVEAKTKDAKYKWFIAHGFSHKAASNSSDFLSLPGPNPGRGDDQVNLAKPSTANDRFVKYSAAEFVDNFLNAWIVEKDFSQAIDFFDVQEIAAELGVLGYNQIISGDAKGGSGGPSLYFEPVRRWTESFLRLWLFEDHSLANRVHHGMDAERGGVLFEKFNLEGRQLQFSSLTEAIEWKGSKPYQIILLDKDNNPFDTRKSYAVAFRFFHTPKDVIILIIKSQSVFHWRITRMFSMVAG
jgi:hypothetical protein